jgi:hypothetical protein
MDMPASMESVSREEVLEAMAEVMERQGRVARAEAALEAARRRLGESVARLSRVSAARGQGVDLPPLAIVALSAPASGAATSDSEPMEQSGTLRERIMAVMEASPEAVYTPARLAPLVGSQNRDSVRNTLLVLAAKGRIEKRGAGQYQARRAAC